MNFVAGSEGRGLGPPPSGEAVAPPLQTGAARGAALKPLVGLVPYVLAYSGRVAAASRAIEVSSPLKRPRPADRREARAPR